VAEKALASLVQVGWWVERSSEAVQKHDLTDEQRRRKLMFKKLSFSTI